MKNEQRTTSIARRINRSWLFRMLGTFLLLDILLLSTLLGGFCYAAEGGNLRAHSGRDMTWDERAPAWERLETLR